MLKTLPFTPFQDSDFFSSIRKLKKLRGYSLVNEWNSKSEKAQRKTLFV